MTMLFPGVHESREYGPEHISDPPGCPKVSLFASKKDFE
jgi:hypothetical protein